MSFLRKSFSQLSYFPPVWFAEADDSHLLPEERRDYYGNGKAALVDAKRQADDDLIAQVIDKWETIERVRESDKEPSLPPAEQIIHDAAPLPDTLENQVDLQALSKLAAQDLAAIESAKAAHEAIARAVAQQRRNEEALILILAQL